MGSPGPARLGVPRGGQQRRRRGRVSEGSRPHAELQGRRPRRPPRLRGQRVGQRVRRLRQLGPREVDRDMDRRGA